MWHTATACRELPQGQTTPQTIVSTQRGKLAGVDASGDIFIYNANGIFEVTYGTSTVTQIAASIYPNSLMLASDGNLYGTESAGQNSDGSSNDGSVFEVSLTAATISTSTLATFDGSGENGSAPQGVAVDSSGNVFGVTKEGGTDNSGTAFEIVNGSGAATTLVNFNQDATSVGGQPICPPTIDSDGDLIGINIVGGANGFGSIWGIAPGTTTAVDLVDLNNADIPGSGNGLGFAKLQSAAPTADATHPAFENTVAAIYGYFGFGGSGVNRDSPGGLGLLLSLVPPETLGGGGGGGDGGGGGGSGGAGVSAQGLSGSVPSSVVGGQTAKSKVDVSVQNTSSAAVKGNVTVQLYVSPDGTLANATPVGSPITKKVSLKASASKAISIKIKWSAGGNVLRRWHARCRVAGRLRRGGWHRRLGEQLHADLSRGRMGCAQRSRSITALSSARAAGGRVWMGPMTALPAAASLPAGRRAGRAESRGSAGRSSGKRGRA